MDADLDTLSSPFIARLTISCRNRQGTPADGHRRGGRHALCRPGDHGDPERPAVPQGRRASDLRTCSRRCPCSRVLQAPPRLADTIEWLMGVFASQSPGYHDDLLLIDSTPVECARSRETVKRSALADAADYG